MHRHSSSKHLAAVLGTPGGLALLLAAVVPTYAHHAFGAEFDPNRPLLLKGAVVRVEWMNPHTWIHIEVADEAGNKESWMIEGSTPNSLLLRGLKRNTIKIGQVVIVDGYQAKDRSNRANSRDVTFEDGRKFFFGSSGTGAPYDKERRGQ